MTATAPKTIITPEWKRAWSIIQNTNKPLFLTGKAGTGKSTFVRQATAGINKNFIKLGSTGISAINIGGQTCHSFFRLPFHPVPQSEQSQFIQPVPEYDKIREVIWNAETIIIDEISMIKSDMIDSMDYYLRINGGNPKLPFGGKQMVFVGDLFQLEPVVNKNDKPIYDQFKYRSYFFFDAKILQQTGIEAVEFQKVFCQQDTGFVDILNRIRVGRHTNKDLVILNKNCVKRNAKAQIYLSVSRKIAEAHNASQLKKLNGKIHSYEAQVSGFYPKSEYPTEKFLKFKKNTRVMFAMNDPNKQFVNGTLGYIRGFEDDVIEVETDDGFMVHVEDYIWENTALQWNKEKKRLDPKVVGTFFQMPLKQAWAITVHKSQGLTFDSTRLDFGRKAFANGCTYTALSRVRSMEGFSFVRPIRPDDILVSKDVLRFYHEKM